MPGELWLIRHGETEWSLSGQHTGRTDIPLTTTGREQAAEAGRRLNGRHFALVLTSPLQRAAETCRIAGYGAAAQIEPNLQEWHYGDYEGLTTAEIQRRVPGWSPWRDGVKNGETLEELAARADRVIERASQADGDAALFAHGHVLRALAARWLGLPASAASYFALATASISVLGYERENRVISRWNHFPGSR